MFAILVPVALAPLIITLVWAERKAKRLALVSSQTGESSGSYLQRIIKVADQLDVVGLVLIGTSVALILLPLTLYSTAKNGWHNGSYTLLHRPIHVLTHFKIKLRSLQ